MEFNKKTMMILAISLIFIVNAVAAFAALNDLTLGMNNAMSGFSNWAQQNNSLPVRIAIIAILSGPILFMLWVAGKESNPAQNWTLSFVTVFVMTYVSFSFTDIKSSFLGCWIISTATILRNAAKNKEGGDSFMNWLSFGIVSMFVAPFGSLLYAGAKLPNFAVGLNPLASLIQLGFSPMGWIYFGLLMGSFGGSLNEFRKNKGEKLLGGIGDSLSKKNSKKGEKDSEEEEKKTEDEEKTDKKANDKMDDAQKELEKGNIEAANKDLTVSAEFIKNSAGIAHAYPVADGGMVDIVKKVLEQNERLVNAVLQKIETKDYFKTRFGEAHAYLFDLHKKMKEEMQGKDWPEFMKLKQDNFKEVIEKLRETKISYMERCAKILEKRANRTTVKTFTEMLENWVLELVHMRKTSDKMLNKSFKSLEKSNREAEKSLGPLRESYEKISKDEENLKRYDEKAREYYKEMQDTIEEIKKSTLPIDRRKELVGGMRTRMNWIVTYLGDKRKYLKSFAEEFDKSEKLITSAKASLRANALAMKDSSDVFTKIDPEQLKEIQKNKYPGSVELKREIIKEEKIEKKEEKR